MESRDNTSLSVLFKHRNDKPLLTNSRELHQDVESLIGRLSPPEVRDCHPRLQRSNTVVTNFDSEELKRIPGVTFETYIDLKMHSKLSHNVYVGL